MRTWNFNPTRRVLAGVAVMAAVATGVTLRHSASVAQEASEAKPATSAHVEAEKQHAMGLSQVFRKTAEEIVPAVVTIETSTKARQVRGGDMHPGDSDGMLEENPFKGTPFEDFFKDNAPNGRFHGRGGRQQMPRREGTGSGVIIDKSGLILTNNHVVEGADEVTVRLNDGREFKGTDIHTDPHSDLAILRIKATGSLPYARLGDSNKMGIGDWVIAVGNPFGLDSTVSAGIISGKGRELGAGQRTRYLQTDAAINPGNSGGPLVNLDGEVVGINTAIATNSGGYQGVGFAIPSNLAKWVVQQLAKSGSVQRAYLGVGIEPVSGDLAHKFGVERGHGVLVAEVFPQSPAAEAGFKEGDVITNFAGTEVKTPRDLQEIVEQAPLGSKQAVVVQRDGKPVNLQVTVKQLPKNLGQTAHNEKEEEESNSHGSSFKANDLGMEVTDMSAEQAKSLGLDGYKGALVSEVTPEGLAAEAGIREGMLVLKVGKKPVENMDQFKAALQGQSVKDGILLLVRTEAGNRFIVLRQEAQ